ncbi:MAG: M13 family metallopeptidase [Bacteroidetes bacterium]|nr:M13 family metallopeptidase [Bacteroidota bacterium]MCL2303074.1 M13 family metallopeptidase [Lentimicrobiaceae bacterium]
MKKYFILALGALAFTTFSCSMKPKELTSGIDFANLDTTVSPAVDFYRYACGGWMDRHPLTGEYARYGSFDKLAEENKEQLKGLITSIAAKKHEKNSIKQKIGDLYNLGMDTKTIEKQGADPLQDELKAIAKINSKEQLPEIMADMQLTGSNPFFGVFGQADPANSSMNIAWIWQSGLGIGDRSYYLEASTEPIREAYLALLEKMFALSGYAKMAGVNEKQLAQDVLNLEIEMAKVFMPKEDLRNPHNTDNPKTLAELQALLPDFSFENFLTSLQLNNLEKVNVGQVDYLKGLNNILNITDLETIKAYLAWNTINDAAPFLSEDFAETKFDFYGKTLSGKEENQPRWKRVVTVVDGSLGEAVGQMYVEKYFPAEAKERMLHLVQNLRFAMEDRINNLTWMSDETKEKAIDKLNAMIIKIGYPETWRDYSALEIDPSQSYYANVVRASRFENEYQLSKIGKPVDPTVWLMTPQTVNAYYNPTTNEICFPAGILQPPFFDMNADDAVNYGAIGVVIGHEITHGFDDQGRNYDKIGNLSNWWIEEDEAKFKERSQILVEHYNQIEVLPGIFANGTFTLGENIADNGGINVSYQALQKAKEEGRINGVMDGFTPEQRFFIAYANIWAGNIRDEEKARRTKEGVHSLAEWRVKGALPHSDEFIEAFNIKEGDPMWLAPEKRARIW